MALLSINPAGRERIINPGSIYIRICNPNEPGGTNPAQHKGLLPRNKFPGNRRSRPATAGLVFRPAVRTPKNSLSSLRKLSSCIR